LVEILPRFEASIDVSATRLPHTAARLIGRDEDLTRLDAAWNDSRKNVVIVRAFGGMGKTSLVATWMAELAMKNWRGAERVFDCQAGRHTSWHPHLRASQLSPSSRRLAAPFTTG
jgi:hypothetical protein